MIYPNKPQIAMNKVANTWFIKYLKTQQLFQLDGSLATLWDLLLRFAKPSSNIKFMQQKFSAYYNQSTVAAKDFPHILQLLIKNNLVFMQDSNNSDSETFSDAKLVTTTKTNNILQSMLQKYTAAKKLIAADYEMTNRCNFHCLYCYNYAADLQKHSKNELAKAQITIMMQELAKAGVFFLTLTGGECTLAPNFEHALAAARENYLDITIFSNGSTITPQLIAIFNKYNVSEIKISIYGANENEYYQFTKRRNYYVKIRENLAALKTSGINVTTRIIVTALHNNVQNTISDLIALEIPFEIQTTIMPTIAGDTAPYKYLAKNQILTQLTQCGHIQKPNRSSLCNPGVTKFRILPDGTITACAMLRTALGNIKTAPIAAILANRTTKNVRKLVRKTQKQKLYLDAAKNMKATPCPALFLSTQQQK